MPAKNSKHTMTRQWELLKLLPSRGPGSTARELCEKLNGQGHEVSKRQVERDLGDLMEIFPIDCNNASKPYGWRWVKDAQIDIPGIGIAEALSIKLTEGSISPLLPSAIVNSLKPRIQQAEKLLNQNSASNSQAKWVNKIRAVSPTLPLRAPKIVDDVLEKIQNALLDDLKVEARYQSAASDKAHRYLINPLALIQRGLITYLVATVEDFTDIRLFALHRFKQATKTNDSAVIPEGFNLDDYIEAGHLNFGLGKVIQLKAYIADYLAKILEETPISEDQKITVKDEKPYVTATIRDSWQLQWWILSHGDGIEIVGPKALRNTIGESLKSAAQYY